MFLASVHIKPKEANRNYIDEGYEGTQTDKKSRGDSPTSILVEFGNRKLDSPKPQCYLAESSMIIHFMGNIVCQSPGSTTSSAQVLAMVVTAVILWMKVEALMP